MHSQRDPQPKPICVQMNVVQLANHFLNLSTLNFTKQFIKFGVATLLAVLIVESPRIVPQKWRGN